MKRGVVYTLAYLGLFAILLKAAGLLPDLGGAKVPVVGVIAIVIWVGLARWLARPDEQNWLARTGTQNSEQWIRRDERRKAIAELNQAAATMARQNIGDSARVARAYRGAALYLAGTTDDKDT